MGEYCVTFGDVAIAGIVCSGLLLARNMIVARVKRWRRRRVHGL